MSISEALPIPRRGRFSDGTVTGDEVRHLRLRLELSQEGFAHELGVSVGTVNRWEKGKVRISRLAATALEALRLERGLPW